MPWNCLSLQYNLPTEAADTAVAVDVPNDADDPISTPPPLGSLEDDGMDVVIPATEWGYVDPDIYQEERVQTITNKNNPQRRRHGSTTRSCCVKHYSVELKGFNILL